MTQEMGGEKEGSMKGYSAVLDNAGEWGNYVAYLNYEDQK